MRFALPELATLVKPFLVSVKGMIELAEAEKEFLTGVGLSDQALTELKREVAEFEAASLASYTGRRGHIGASADLSFRVIERPFDLTRIESFDAKHYRTVQGLARVKDQDARALLAFLSKSNPQLILDMLNAEGPDEEPDLGVSHLPVGR